MLPMGTVVTVCMVLGLLFATRLPGISVVQQLPFLVRRFVGVVVFSAGAWNVLWYAARHLTERWGVAALVSGLLMMLTACFIIIPDRLPDQLLKARPLILVLLAICALDYGITIYNL